MWRPLEVEFLRWLLSNTFNIFRGSNNFLTPTPVNSRFFISFHSSWSHWSGWSRIIIKCRWNSISVCSLLSVDHLSGAIVASRVMWWRMVFWTDMEPLHVPEKGWWGPHECFQCRMCEWHFHSLSHFHSRKHLPGHNHTFWHLHAFWNSYLLRRILSYWVHRKIYTHWNTRYQTNKVPGHKVQDTKQQKFVVLIIHSNPLVVCSYLYIKFFEQLWCISGIPPESKTVHLIEF